MWVVMLLMPSFHKMRKKPRSFQTICSSVARGRVVEPSAPDAQ